MERGWKLNFFIQYALIIFSMVDSVCCLTFLNFWMDSFQMSLNSNTIWAISPPNIDGFYSTIAHLKAFVPRIPKMVSDLPYLIRERRETQKRKRAEAPIISLMIRLDMSRRTEKSSRVLAVFVLDAHFTWAWLWEYLNCEFSDGFRVLKPFRVL